ncbi:MAG: hypothetical protein ACYSTF_10010 [Planctomycetota bacterium]|jgi:hypothetical protein
MTAELWGVIVGGIIGVVGTLSTTVLTITFSNRRRAKAIQAIAKGEIVAIKEKAERFIDGRSSRAGLGASTPMLTSIASELGFLSEDQAIALRRAVTLDMEMRKEESKEKARLAVKACEDALSILS